MTYEKLNQVDNAITAYKKAISIKNDYAKAHLQLARLLNTKKYDYSGSIAEYLLVLNYDPTNVAAMREIAAVYSLQRNYTDSEKYFRKVPCTAENSAYRQQQGGIPPRPTGLP